MSLESVPVSALSPERFRDIVAERYEEIEQGIEHAKPLLDGKVIWHINSTSAGGGVAELLRSLLAYARGAGFDLRWSVIDGDEEFFRVTKRIHNNLHGGDGDGGGLGDAERRAYERTLTDSTEELCALLRPGDVVYLHDPQTAGMAEALVDAGVTVIWRCHVGLDEPNGQARRAWDFLRGYVEPAQAYVFSRRAFVWEGLDADKIHVIAPSIDAFSPKNQAMEAEVVDAILARIGLADIRDRAPAPVFTRLDGTPGRVDRKASIEQEAPLAADAPMITQVSRWDRLKDPVGVLRGFAEHVDDPDARLVLVGPDVEGVADDPEGAEALAEVRSARAELSPDVMSRTHLVNLPMDDGEENAAMVNAIQRRADIVVQKSIAEGFGLTATEAMWKSRPVIASRVGGLQEQIIDGESGLIVDALDLPAFGSAVESLLQDPVRAQRMGEAARERVVDHYLGTRSLLEYEGLLAELLG